MIRWRDMGKRPQKCPKNGFFLLLVTPLDFIFKNQALSLLNSYGTLSLHAVNYKKLTDVL